MTEKDIKICGHGSGNPSIKNMYDYLEKRYQQRAGNGKRKCLVEVRRRKNVTDEDRKKFAETYKTIIGRNEYSQSLRDYVYKPYKDGDYYSDCSSSGMATWNKIGYKTSNLNTAGIHSSSLFETVPVDIINGHIVNPEILDIGDALLFVGSDPSRPLQIGHVEYIYQMPQLEGWQQSDDGWKYRTASGEYAKGWKIIKNADGINRWYHFRDDGMMDSGLFEAEGCQYYAVESGDLQGALCRTDNKGALSIWDVI